MNKQDLIGAVLADKAAGIETKAAADAQLTLLLQLSQLVSRKTVTSN